MKPNVHVHGLACMLAAFSLPSAMAYAAEESAATEAPPPYTLNTNIGLYSQYIFRGVTYTREKPALQGGVDFAHSSGFYVGFWGSNVADTAINNASLEMDFYGGYTGSVGDVSYDLGLLQFYYPGGKYNVSEESYNTLEAYAGVTWKFLNIKYSHELTDYFGFNDSSVTQDFGLAGNGHSRGSHYLEANLNFELPAGFSLGLHAGHQTVRHYEDFNFTDWKVGVNKDFGGGWLGSVAYVDTNARSNLYTDIHGLNTGRSKWLASIKRTF